MASGEVAVEREVVDGFVWSAKPVRVAADGPLIALYRAVGTRCFWPSHSRGEHRPPSKVVQRPEPWGDSRFVGLLTLVRPGDDISISLMWGPEWSLICWYVDYIEPYVRTPIGWDFRDLHLDLIVRPDRSSYLKDQDELEVAVGRNEISAAVAAAAHERLGHVAQEAASGIGVFGEDWPNWRPDPSWTVPSITSATEHWLRTSPTLANDRLELESWVSA